MLHATSIHLLLNNKLLLHCNKLFLFGGVLNYLFYLPLLMCCIAKPLLFGAVV